MSETTQQASRALILGGGGPTGIAWELGVLAGLNDRNVDVANVGLIVGTSAGSLVGAQLTGGTPLEELFEHQLRPVPEAPTAEVNARFSTIIQTFLAGQGARDAQDARARIGAAALAASSTLSEEEWLARIASLSTRPWQWPDMPQLVVTAVNAHNGEWLTFHRESEVDLLHAVAASCAVPGFYPPVTIQGVPYIDGGVRSGTNADIAVGYKRVLILRPQVTTLSQIPSIAFEDELAELLLTGAQVLVITPDEASAEARGADPMDASHNAAAAQAGRLQGRQMAGSVLRFW